MEKYRYFFIVFLLLPIVSFGQTSLETAITRANSDSSTINISTRQSITTNDTLTAVAGLSIANGGRINISSGDTLWVFGSFIAGSYQVFEGSGEVIFGSGSVAYVDPRWFPTSVSAASIESKASVANAVVIVPGSYSTDSTFTGTAPIIDLRSGLLRVTKSITADSANFSFLNPKSGMLRIDRVLSDNVVIGIDSTWRNNPYPGTSPEIGTAADTTDIYNHLNMRYYARILFGDAVDTTRASLYGLPKDEKIVFFDGPYRNYGAIRMEGAATGIPDSTDRAIVFFVESDDADGADSLNAEMSFRVQTTDPNHNGQTIAGLQVGDLVPPDRRFVFVGKVGGTYDNVYAYFDTSAALNMAGHNIINVDTLGIGTTSPNTFFHIFRTGGQEARMLISSEDSSVAISLLAAQSNSEWKWTAREDSVLSLRELNSGTTPIRIDKSGSTTKVGIMGSADSTLTVNGAFHSTSNAKLDANIIAVGLPTAAASTDINIDGSDKLHKVSSSRRYKKEIKNLEVDSRLIYKLKPRSFTWNEKTASNGMRDFGLIAEEVEKVLPEMVVYDGKGRPEGLRSGKLTYLLLAEMQKLHKEVSKLKKEVTKLRKKIK